MAKRVKWTRDDGDYTGHVSAHVQFVIHWQLVAIHGSEWVVDLIYWGVPFREVHTTRLLADAKRWVEQWVASQEG
jgi:hypothetical protein